MRLICMWAVPIHHKGTKLTQRNTKILFGFFVNLCGSLCLCGEKATAYDVRTISEGISMTRREMLQASAALSVAGLPSLDAADPKQTPDEMINKYLAAEVERISKNFVDGAKTK